MKDFFKDFAKIAKTPTLQIKPLVAAFIIRCNNSRYYERCQQTPPRSFSILIKDSHLRETDLHETSKRKVLTKLHSKRLNYVRLLVLIEIQCVSRTLSNI